MNDHEPAGSTGGGARAPFVLDDRREFAASHWCKPVGARVYCDKIDCERCGPNEDE